MKEELEALLGPVAGLSRVARGYTNNGRVVATFRDGRSVFAKRAVDIMSAQWLRMEHRMYEELSAATVLPELIAWIEGDLPILVAEDLSDALWPPPWDERRVDAVLRVLAEVAACRPSTKLPELTNDNRSGEGWNRVMADPTEFLALGICSDAWLRSAGPVLAAAADAAPLAGECLLHCDVRSDNLCFRGGTALLVDWNLVSIGNPQFDVAFWLPSLAAEGGPAPEQVMPGCPPELAAYVAGFFASRAGQPQIPHTPMVRHIQRVQLETALPWAVRALGLALPR